MLKRLAAGLLACLALAFALQIPIAWGVVVWMPRSSHGEVRTSYQAPASAAVSPVRRLDITNRSARGWRELRIVAWPMDLEFPSASANPRQSAETPAPTYPWPPERIHRGLVDPAAWPAAGAVPSWFAAREFGFTLGERTQVGWPWPAVECHTWLDPRDGSVRRRGAQTFVRPAQYNAGLHATGRMPLPMLPVWHGWLVNTLVHGAGLFAVALPPFLLARRVRATVRHRRGLCVACGYAMHGTPIASPCPECGAKPAA